MLRAQKLEMREMGGPPSENMQGGPLFVILETYECYPGTESPVHLGRAAFPWNLILPDLLSVELNGKLLLHY